MAIVLSFIGAPGSGKGTQGKLLEKSAGFFHIATGDLIRKRMKESDETALAIKKLYDKGVPQPDHVVASLVFEEAQKHVNKKGFIFDPFPLSFEQIHLLDSFIAKYPDELSEPFLIDFILSEEECVKRLVARHAVEGRSDDKEDVVRRRYREYEQLLKGVIEHYKGEDRYIEIDGSPSIEKVHELLLVKLKERKLIP